MKKWAFCLSVGTATFILSSCQPENKEQCYELPAWENITYVSGPVNIYEVAANPTNPDEFAYVYYVPASTGDVMHIDRYNTAIGEKEFLMEAETFNIPASTLCWSSKGYLYYPGENMLHILHVATKTLVVKEYSFQPYHPRCSPDGEMIAMLSHNNQHLYIADENGTLTDTISLQGVNEYSWMNNSHILTWHRSMSKYAVRNVVTGGVTDTGTLSLKALSLDPVDLNGNFIAVTNERKLYRYHALTNTASLLKDKCGDRYTYIQAWGCIPGNKIIALRAENTLTTLVDPVISMTERIVFINPDNGDEQVFDPWGP